MGNTDHCTPEIAVWSGLRGTYHACCDCGWDDQPRWFKFRAIDKAWQHHVDTGHRLCSPLVIDYLSDCWPPTPLVSKLKQYATSWPTAVALLLVPALAGLLLAAPRAGAAIRHDVVTISVVWSGTPDCITLREPIPGDRKHLRNVAACSDTKAVKASYVPQSGDWVGADPDMGGADILACTLSVNGQIVLSSGAARSDGAQVDCLRIWW